MLSNEISGDEIELSVYHHLNFKEQMTLFLLGRARMTWSRVVERGMRERGLKREDVEEDVRDVPDPDTGIR